MADTSITQLEAYTPASYDATADHQADVFVIVDTRDHTMASSGSDKKLSISQFVTTSGGTQPCILDIAFAPVAQGDLIYRGAVDWAVLAPGTSGYILATQGASANPVWRSAATVLEGISSTQGDILYRGASTWGALAPGTPGHVLSSGGGAANPSWVSDPAVATQTAHYVLSGPTTGSPALPTFRALAGNDLPATGLTITQWAKAVGTASGSTGAVTLDFTSTGYNEYVVTLPAAATHADCAITLGAIAVGQTVKVTTVQDSTGGTTVSWPTTNVTVRWAGGTAPTASTGANKADTFVFYSPSSAIGVGGTVALANF